MSQLIFQPIKAIVISILVLIQRLRAVISSLPHLVGRQTSIQFWQGEVDRWHFHSRYLLPSYIKVCYKSMWCSWIFNAYANLWNPYSLLPQKRFTRFFFQPITFHFSSPDLGSVARILQWRHRCNDYLDYHDHDNKVYLIKNVQNSVLTPSPHRILYSTNYKRNGYKLSAQRFLGSFGRTIVTCDWLIVASNNIDQS